VITRRDALRLLGAGALAAGGAAAGGCSGASGAAGVESRPVPDRYPINGPPAIGDALVSGSIGEATTFIWFLASDGASHAASGMVLDSLIRYNDRLEIEPALAERFVVSPDGLTITFHLRKNVRWTDGHPFTAEDVLFTYQTIIDKNTPTPYADDYLRVRKAEVVGPYTFRVHYDRPFAPALESWGAGIIPAHILRGHDITKHPYGRNPTAGLGPYMLREWIPGQRMVTERNPDYWEGTVWIANQVTRIIPDPQTQFLELKTGGLDSMSLTPTQFEFQTGTVEFRTHFDKYRYYANVYTYLGMNLKDPRFADVRVRRAFAYAIDKDELIRGVLFGHGKPISAPYRPGHWAYNPNVVQYEYNPQKALRLLEEAGWTRDGNGRQVKDGRPFAFEIITNQGNAPRLRTAEIIQRRLAEIGIEVSVRPIEWAAFIKDFINAGRFEAMILGWSMPPDPDQWAIWHSSQAEPGKLNHVYYKNPEVDRLLEAGRSTFDREERKRIYFRFQEIMAEEQPYVFLYVPEALVAIHKRVKGIVPTENGVDYKSAVRWFVPKPYQKWVNLV
jgi:peptide/nickel transport system substrate-binding protein